MQLMRPGLEKAIYDYLNTSASTSIVDAFRAGVKWEAKDRQKLILETRISERKQCIYIIEMDLMDHADTDEAYSEDYFTALIDEVKNHKNYIMDYEQELTNLQIKQ